MKCEVSATYAQLKPMVSTKGLGVHITVIAQALKEDTLPTQFT
jgi:hypothetical protein